MKRKRKKEQYFFQIIVESGTYMYTDIVSIYGQAFKNFISKYRKGFCFFGKVNIKRIEQFDWYVEMNEMNGKQINDDGNRKR